MKRNEKRLSLADIKEMDMVNYLASLGFEPAKIRRHDYWYYSPLRQEKTPSFKVNRAMNRWYDHGIGKGGNLVDFSILYHDCTIAELLQMLSGNLSFHQPTFHIANQLAEKENKIHVLGDFTLTSFSLLNYLQQRGIPITIADAYCREVRYEMNGKTYYGIGFKNDAGGWEIRNPYFKTSSTPKSITTVKKGGRIAAVFEGFFDFLSFLFIIQRQPENVYDFIILNSLSFFEKALPVMENYEAIHLFLDNDEAGQNCSRQALSISEKFVDESSLYQQYKDLNEWLVCFGTSQSKGQYKN